MQADRYTDTDNWYKAYLHALEKTFWAVDAFSFEDMGESSSGVGLHTLLSNFISSFIPAIQAAVLGNVMGALQSATNAGALSLWSSHNSHDNQGQFQAGIAGMENGHIVLYTAAMHYTESSSSSSGFLGLWSSSSSSMHLFQGQESAELDDQMYTHIREKIQQKMFRDAIDFIDSINLP